MQYRFLVPHWGSDPKYTDLLFSWVRAYESSGAKAPFTVISDTKTPKIPSLPWEAFDTSKFKGAISENNGFDRKGAIVSLAITAIQEPVLVLDADAFLQFDPEPLLSPFEGVPFAMPKDFGAPHLRIRNRHMQETPVTKRCAGVLWFGGGNRDLLCIDYLIAFDELKAGRYFEERRLFEQHAWAMVAHKHKAPFLPDELNWPDIIPRYGPNPKAAIYHRIGQRKWRKPHVC
jgi:hypothetical protein